MITTTAPDASMAPKAGRVGESDAHYDAFLASIQSSIEKEADEPLFTTDVNPLSLWGRYLGLFPKEQQQHYTCNCCRHFIQRYGLLARLSKEGWLRPAFWSPTYDARKNATSQHVWAGILSKAFDNARVTGIFIPETEVLGTPVTGEWRHMAATVPRGAVHKSLVKTAGQAMAEKREDHRNVMTALDGYEVATIGAAVRLLESDALYQGEKLLERAKWFHDLARIDAAPARSRTKENKVWLAVAKAPAGFCHIRSGMLGTLLDDIQANKHSFEEVAARFKEKMHPLKYLRPQAAPAAGTIAQAEKIVAALGTAGSLARRFMKPEEVTALWRPPVPAAKPAREGVFGHIKAKDEKTPAPPTKLLAPPRTMTWAKFSREVLPTAERIQLLLWSGDLSFCTLTTAVDPAAPPILQWDDEGNRNPAAWYCWTGGAPASQYGLMPRTFHDVSAVTLRPWMWGNAACDHQGKGVVFLLEGAKETRQPSLCLFPVFLKAEYHGIRSAIEAFSRAGSLAGIQEGPHASGLAFAEGAGWGRCELRVTAGGVESEYTLDRWD